MELKHTLLGSITLSYCLKQSVYWEDPLPPITQNPIQPAGWRVELLNMSQQVFLAARWTLPGPTAGDCLIYPAATNWIGTFENGYLQQRYTPIMTLDTKAITLELGYKDPADEKDHFFVRWVGMRITPDSTSLGGLVVIRD